MGQVVQSMIDDGWIVCDYCLPTIGDSDCEEQVWLASETYLMGRCHYSSVKAKNGYAVGTLYWKPTNLERPTHPCYNVA